MANTIATLRDLVPFRPLTVPESLRIAELQARRLRSLSGVKDLSFPESAISSLPRVQVERMTPAPASGASQWSFGRWVILLNGADPSGSQRFSLMHELKHILDHPFFPHLYPTVGNLSARERHESVCDYFAACVLMPRSLVYRAWATTSQDIRTLAHLFDVSRHAMHTRLEHIGLINRQPRCLHQGGLV